MYPYTLIYYIRINTHEKGNTNPIGRFSDVHQHEISKSNSWYKVEYFYTT